MPTAYIASPLGFSAATAAYYSDILLPAVRAVGVEPLDPWGDAAAPASFRAALALPPGPAQVRALRSINARLGLANTRMIEASDGLLAVLDGVDVDSGTAAEIGFAAARRKPIVGLRLDTRRTGDNDGASVNLQVEYFIAASGGHILWELGGAVAALAALLSAPPAPADEPRCSRWQGG